MGEEGSDEVIVLGTFVEYGGIVRGPRGDTLDVSILPIRAGVLVDRTSDVHLEGRHFDSNMLVNNFVQVCPHATNPTKEKLDFKSLPSPSSPPA